MGSRGQQPTNPHVHAITENYEQITFGCINLDTINRSEALAKIEIHIQQQKHFLKSKVDTGVQGNMIPMRIYRDMFPHDMDNNGLPLKHAANSL